MTYTVLKQIVRSSDGQKVTCFVPAGASASNLGGAGALETYHLAMRRAAFRMPVQEQNGSPRALLLRPAVWTIRLAGSYRTRART